MEKINTGVFGLYFFLKGNRLCFVIDEHRVDKKEKRFWVDLSPKAFSAVSKIVNDHLEAETEERKLTPQQLAEKYEEMMGS